MAENVDQAKQKIFKKKLTPFLCQEMLYDYAMNRLDAGRKSAIEEFLARDAECRGILESIRASLKYSEALGRTQLNPEVATHLREAENAVSIGRKYSSWKQWPEVIRWSFTAILLSIAVAGIVAVIPWEKIPSMRSKPSDTVNIAAIPAPSEEQLEAMEEAQETDPASAAEQGSGDHEIEPPDAADQAKLAAANKAPPGKPHDSEGSGDDSHDTPAAPPPQPVQPAETSAAVAAAPSATVDGKKDGKPKGYVFRAFMTLSNLDDVAPKITENITDLGGEKAGEVELGWVRGTGRYYHFSMPEENEAKLLDQLRAYGPVRISKDPHPRVMPQGKVRFILWVESAQ